MVDLSDTVCGPDSETHKQRMLHLVTRGSRNEKTPGLGSKSGGEKDLTKAFKSFNLPLMKSLVVNKIY